MRPTTGGSENECTLGGFSPDGRWLVAGSYRGVVSVYDLVKPEGSFGMMAHREYASGVFADGGSLLVTSSA